MDGGRDRKSRGQAVGGREAQGGVALTVVGSLAPARVDGWRAGRRVRVPRWFAGLALSRSWRARQRARPGPARGTTLVGTVKSGALVETVARGSWWSEAIGAVRAFSRGAIAAAVGRWSARSAAIVAAIVIGDRAGLDDDVQRRLQEAGTYHVIAISGGNIAILAGLLLGAFRIAGWLGRTAMLASIVVLVVYAALVGGGASVDRATLMAVVYFAGRAAGPAQPAAERARSSPRSSLPRRRCRWPIRRSSSRSARRSRSCWLARSCIVSDRSRRLVQASARRCLAASVAAEAALLSRRRARVLARHLRGPRAELPGDSADGRRADRRDGGRARSPWSRAAWRCCRVACSRISAPRAWCGRPIWSASRRR